MPRTRIVAVLFTDVVGSTALLSRVGPSAADELRDRHFAEMRSALAVHRGTEVKTLGDGVMAVFDDAASIGPSAGLQRHDRPDRGTRWRAAHRVRTGLWNDGARQCPRSSIVEL